MESGDIFRAAGSLRRGSSSICRTDDAEIFSRESSHRDNDEEDLRWAALEKLPTYDRLRTGILELGSGASEIDVRKLGGQERKNLIDRLVKTEEDNERFLLKLRSRLDRVGISLPAVEVRFNHLNVEADVYVGSRALPTFTNFLVNMLESLLRKYLPIFPSRKRHLHILKDVSGIIKPSRMTLLLGPPNCGKTTLLLALAGKLDPSLKVLGSVTYNGHSLKEFVPERTAAYISQHDVHIGEMTVREALVFSARCHGVGTRYEMLAELARREKALNIKPDPVLDVYMKAAAIGGQKANVTTDYILKVLGLEGCADTMVGDEMLRGISGGQRKRVTTGEMLVGPAKVLLMDEISTGLDSSTTYQIVNFVKQNVHILKGTAIISLLQPTPETYNLFDDIILLSDGHIVYQGPRENVLEFFEYMGFRCPERKGVADFLQEVTSRIDQRQYWMQTDASYRVITAREFSESFQSFHLGRRLVDELTTPFDRLKSHRAALTTKKYGVSRKELFIACFSREFLLMKRSSSFYIFKLTQLVITTVIGMTLFLRTEMHRDSVADGGIYLGALFFILTVILFSTNSELSMTITKLPVFYKQRGLLFFPAWAYAIPTWILKIPLSFIEVATMVFLPYYVIGFDSSAERFFRQFLILVLVNQMGYGLFRFLAAVSRSMIVANIVGSFVQLLLFTLGGVILSRDKISKLWAWGYWVTPMTYGQNAMAVNEFLGSSWSHVPPNSTEPLGVQVLKDRGFFTEDYWYWLGVGALAGFTLLFNFLYALALTFLKSFEKPQAVINEDLPDEPGKAAAAAIPLTNLPISSSHQIDRDLLDLIRSPRPMLNKRRGMVLPFQPHSMAFDEITYSVDMPKEMKNQGVTEDKLVLLKGVSGSFRPGVLTALMGVSGAGKTTLMDVLAGRKTGGYIDGNITVSGYPKKQETFSRISGYCEQNDIHSPFITVHESLLFSAWLRLPTEVDAETRKMFVEEVMELVELNPIRQAIVGLPGVNGLSIEQRKRLTIAVELVANPSIIFMDEPTSGLDARAAAIIMRTVRNTVDTGRTVVCTIHQPSIDIFEAFDELLLLKLGGLQIYAGPLGHHSCHLIKYFEDIEGVSKIEDGYNPATWMLEVTNRGKEINLGVDFAKIYKNSELYRRNKAIIQDLSKPASGSKDLHFPTPYSQSFHTQCLACLWKQHLSYWRNPQYTTMRCLVTIITALILGTVFWDLGTKTSKPQDLYNAMGSMYDAVLFLGSQYAGSVQPIIIIERTVSYREKAAGMYSSLPFAFGQVLIELPYVLIQGVVYGVIVYSMIGFEWSISKFLWYLYFMNFTLLYFTIYGMMTVAMSPNQNFAAVLSGSFYGMFNLFSGFVIPRPRIALWWRWYCWINPVAWTLYGLVSSQYGDKKELFETGESVEHFVRTYFGFNHDFLGGVAAIILGFTVLFTLCFAFCIKKLNFHRR